MAYGCLYYICTLRQIFQSLKISLPMNMHADQIYQIGQALAPLREKQILLIGSGSITHNLRELSWNGKDENVPEWASTFKKLCGEQTQS